MNTQSTDSRTAAAILARRQRTAGMLDDVQQALRKLGRGTARVTFRGVAARAGVSRTFLYENPQARQLVEQAIAAATQQRRQVIVEQDVQQDNAWRERALNAEDALQAGHAEIRSQRAQIAQLMGQVRDLEQEWSSDGVQRIASENTTLKQRTRQLAQDNRALDERLQAARSNSRFQDRKIAQLEAQLAEQHPANVTNMHATQKPRSEPETQ